MEVWSPVLVTNEELERFNTAGTVYAVTKRNPDGTAKEVEVKFDIDGEVETLAVSDLRELR